MLVATMAVTRLLLLAVIGGQGGAAQQALSTSPEALTLTEHSAQLGAPVTPISKVLDLLNDMLSKGIKAKEDEANKYAAFAQWCEDTKRVKSNEIADGAAAIETHEAQIAKAESVIGLTSARIAELDEDYGRWSADQKAATEVRDREKADYTATERDYSESIDALSQAIAVLGAQDYSRAQPEETSLVQALLRVHRARAVPQSAKSALAAFLDMSQDPLDVKAPDAYSYEFQSGGVIDMLEKLLDEFKDKLYELNKEEKEAQHGFDQMLQQLTDDKKLAKHEAEQKATLRVDTAKDKASESAALEKTIAEKSEDETYLAGLEALCAQKKTDFETREAIRADEIKAMQEAIQIISSETVAGSGEKYLPKLLQGSNRTALGQLRGDHSTPLQERIAVFLAGRGKLSGSKLLSQLATQVAANPFGKVKKLIQELIWKLTEEGTTETENHGWCQAELATNTHTRTTKTEDANKLTALVEELQGSIAQISQELVDLATAIAELEKAMADATEERAASKATNEQTIKDAKEAQIAVSQAIGILKEYYEKASKSTSLVQQTPIEDAPETFDKPYKGMIPEGGNIVDFMKVILEDFTRLDAETTAAEAEEASQHDSFMHESNKDKSLKEGSVTYLTGKKQDQEQNLASTEEELKAVKDQLQKAEAYYEKLKPMCVDSGITYEERVKLREQEMQSLQEALEILTGADVNLK